MTKKTWLVFAVALLVGCSGPSSGGHQSFASPEAAVDALIGALEKNDTTALSNLLGPDSEELIDSGDPVQDASDRKAFVASYRQKHSLVEDREDRRTLVVGEHEWPLPVPVVRRGGRWYLDGVEGTDEIIYRRIGANELGAIAVARGFVEAQQDYTAEGHDGDPPGIYALKLLSDEGRQNGLYWPTADDEPPSPAGPFVGDAAAEGYRSGRSGRQPYHGYQYRMLYRQGPNARGGARDYFRDGLLTQGFALVAWPAEYGVSGIMTFVVNQDGAVYQKDLGEDTESQAAAISAVDRQLLEGRAVVADRTSPQSCGRQSPLSPSMAKSSVKDGSTRPPPKPWSIGKGFGNGSGETRRIKR
jgi:hypothetical protein